MKRLLLLLSVLVSVAPAQMTCSRTPELAAGGVPGRSTEFGESGGYRVVAVRRDLVGQGTWAEVRACAHPEWPAYIVPASAEAVPTQKRPLELAVRFGERVFVRQNTASARIQIVGIADRSGAIGDQIPISIASFGDQGMVRRNAVIRGKGEVELQ